VPALPPVPKVIKVEYGFTIGEDLGALCREFFSYTGAGASGTDLATLCENIGVSFATNLAPLMTADRILETVTITDLTSDTAPQAFALIDTPGTNDDTKLPASAALLQSFEIDRRYRGGHPRTYWPFGGEADMQDAQTWTTVFIGTCGDALAAHFAEWSADLVPGITTVTPVNVSYYEGFTVHTGTTGRARNVSTPRVTPVVDGITGYITRTGIAQIRRRLLHLA